MGSWVSAPRVLRAPRKPSGVAIPHLGVGVHCRTIDIHPSSRSISKMRMILVVEGRWIMFEDI